MDPVTVIAIIELAIMATKGVAEAYTKLKELHEFSDELRASGRDATPEEWDAALERALGLDERMDAAIEKLKAREEARAARRPKPVVVAEPEVAEELIDSLAGFVEDILGDGTGEYGGTDE